jgi:Ca2+-binding EF-hand superfamily protein
VEQITFCFEDYDINGNGKLEKFEVRKIFDKKFEQEESPDKEYLELFEQTFHSLDIDKDGSFNKIEFYIMMDALQIIFPIYG